MKNVVKLALAGDVESIKIFGKKVDNLREKGLNYNQAFEIFKKKFGLDIDEFDDILAEYEANQQEENCSRCDHCDQLVPDDELYDNGSDSMCVTCAENQADMAMSILDLEYKLNQQEVKHPKR